MSLYPLKFKPRFVEKIWGGRKLETVLGKALPPGKPVGESWELYDFPPGVVDQSGGWVSSVVANGPLAGRTLHDLVGEHGAALHGDVPLLNGQQFPILIKFLDAREDLSLQVHPPKAYADAHPGSHLKTEAWYVMENDPGARLYRGLLGGVSAEAFREGIADGSVMQLVNAVEVEPGQCFFLPSGTVHALGAGILVAEVQTPSDTTFRVFDFNRLESGKPRKLHVEEALQCIDFSDASPQGTRRRKEPAELPASATRLVSSDYFTIERVRFDAGVQGTVPYDQPAIWMMLHGRAEVRVDGVSEPVTLAKGETVLIPARIGNAAIRIIEPSSWLEVTLPTS
jgi:mannose-6-phosphate isomerase